MVIEVAKTIALTGSLIVKIDAVSMELLVFLYASKSAISTHT